MAVAMATAAAAAIFAPFLFGTHNPTSMISTAYVMAAGGWQHRLSQPIVVSTSPLITVRTGQIAISKDVREAATSGAELIAKVADGSVPLMLDDALIEIELSRGASPANPDLSGADGGDQNVIAPVVSALQSVDFSDLRLRNTTLVAIGSDGVATRFHNVDARLLRQSGRTRAQGQMGYRNETIKFDVEAARSKLVDDIQTAPFKATISNSLVSTSVTGIAKFGATTNIQSNTMDLRIPDVATFAKWLGAAWPSRNGVQSFAVSGQMTWADAKLSFPNSKFIIDGNVANGSMAVSQTNDITLIDGTLAFGTLDAETYLGSDDGTSTDFGSQADWLAALAGAAAGKSLMGELNKVHADLRLSAAVFKARAFRATDVAASINLDHGKLIADIASMQLASGGQGSVQISIDNQGPRAKCRLLAKLEGMDLALGSAVLFGAPIITGPGRVTANLSASGLDRDELLASVDGKLYVDSVSSVGVQVDLASLLSAFRKTASAAEASGERNAQKWSTPWAGVTQISNLKAKLRADQGQLFLDEVVGRTGTHAFAVRGAADLADKEVDLKLFIGDPAAPDGVPDANRADGAAYAGGDRPGLPRSAVWDGAQRPTGIENGDVVHFTGDWYEPVVIVEPIATADNDLVDADAGTDFIPARLPNSAPASIQ
ncbi:MAG: AsmA-like C-terminal region-containing protein [Pseudomonadota bacterium]